MAIYAIEDPTYQPALRIISAITQDYPAVITTSFDHDYSTGDILRIYIPDDFGMKGLDRLYGPITIIDSTNFKIDIDTRNFDAFSVPAGALQRAKVVPIGVVASSSYGASKNVLGSDGR